tara:strand:+ start:8738 stop:9391 length:654 start_codon:yes stop_codon:yes gene_type:complete
MWKITFIIIVFILGLYFSMFYNNQKIQEGFKVNKNACPNILIQKGKDIFLYNSKQAKIPGVNPIKFNNLEDYVEFIDWQRSQNINCPVLFLQHSYDAQGKSVYQIRPSPTELGGGLNSTLDFDNISPGVISTPEVTKLINANRNDPPYNQNSYPGFDALNQYEGEYTPLDKMYNEQEVTSKLSTNAMDTNWGGVEYTNQAIKQGLYDEDNVEINVNN